MVRGSRRTLKNVGNRTSSTPLPEAPAKSAHCAVMQDIPKRYQAGEVRSAFHDESKSEARVDTLALGTRSKKRERGAVTAWLRRHHSKVSGSDAR
ncbi:MAG: hypothetical protein EOP12_03290 [Pseudomonas sp.]|nr:MAG: hypothetical protein EOP12_03290 [Pseudomonas sp.]